MTILHLTCAEINHEFVCSFGLVRLSVFHSRCHRTTSNLVMKPSKSLLLQTVLSHERTSVFDPVSTPIHIDWLITVVLLPRDRFHGLLQVLLGPLYVDHRRVQ